ncbi:hypothetical protein [Deinococcus sp. UYEF24]
MPRTTETAAKPRPTKPKKSAPKSAGGRPTTYDWSSIRREYIRGDDNCTLESLGGRTDGPAFETIKRRSAREDWGDLRREFRHKTDARIQELDTDLKVEVRKRHQGAGQSFMELAVAALQYQNPEALEPVDIARYAKIGADLERKALGMEEVTVRLGRIKSPDDLDKLSEADLWQIAGMLPPEDDDDDV